MLHVFLLSTVVNVIIPFPLCKSRNVIFTASFFKTLMHSGILNEEGNEYIICRAQASISSWKWAARLIKVKSVCEGRCRSTWVDFKNKNVGIDENLHAVAGVTIFINNKL